ncbi:MAG TPA: murein biosynthesis integral membrane protein MurJ [Ilumatobacter sp.]|nr:murein biosynthesis integral membrane protein MurJ [Ilumatobacter sp.]
MSGLLRSNLTVAVGTALSRVSGLLRVIVFGYVIGQSALADAYKLSNETPNIIYDLLLGGVLSATLVPLFSSLMVATQPKGDDGESIGGETGDDADGRRAANAVITVAVTLLMALTVAAVLAAPLIFRIYSLDTAPGLDVDLYRSVGTTLTRIFVVQILFYGLCGIANAYLNSRRRFFAAAWSPVLPNAIIIVTLLSLPDAGAGGWTLSDVITDSRLRLTLGLGATAGIAAMAVVLVPAMLGAGLKFRPTFEWKHPAVRKLLVLSGWTIGFVAANQVALVVVRNLAQGLGEGFASSYFDAFTWFVLPHGLLAVSIATTFQPEMARAAASKDRTQFLHHSSLGIRAIATLTVPAAAGLLVLSEPIIGLMQRGQFDATDTTNTSRALAGLAIGLVGFSVYLFTLRGFYAHQDTRTPFVLNVGENLLNIVLAFVFVSWWGLFGLGLAYALAYVLAALWALRVLANKVSGFPLRAIWSSVWRALLAGTLMAEAMWFITHNADSNTGWEGAAQVVVGGSAGLVVYAASLVALNAPEVAWIRTKLAR